MPMPELACVASPHLVVRRGLPLIESDPLLCVPALLAPQYVSTPRVHVQLGHLVVVPPSTSPIITTIPCLTGYFTSIETRNLMKFYLAIIIGLPTSEKLPKSCREGLLLTVGTPLVCSVAPWKRTIGGTSLAPCLDTVAFFTHVGCWFRRCWWLRWCWTPPYSTSLGLPGAGLAGAKPACPSLQTLVHLLSVDPVHS